MIRPTLYFYKKSHEQDDACPSEILCGGGLVEVSPEEVLFWDSSIKKGCGIAAVIPKNYKIVVDDILAHHNYPQHEQDIPDPYETGDFFGYSCFDDYGLEMRLNLLERCNHPAEVSFLIEMLYIDLTKYAEKASAVYYSTLHNGGISRVTSGGSRSRGGHPDDAVHETLLEGGKVWEPCTEELADSKRVSIESLGDYEKFIPQELIMRPQYGLGGWVSFREVDIGEVKDYVYWEFIPRGLSHGGHQGDIVYIFSEDTLRKIVEKKLAEYFPDFVFEFGD